ncbi:MAG TPA: hypothetical protein VFE20_07305 [Thermoleophilia bacterium]|nr:hypothetical protein [Thermoleophilia bacterium]
MDTDLPPTAPADHLQRALATLTSFASPKELTLRISLLESSLASLTREQAADRLVGENVDAVVLDAALTIKHLAGRINDIVHAVGILTALPYVLEPGEVILGLSLASGNTGKAYDLETDRQIAEFKFVTWQGGPESIRQNGLFIDLFRLASADTDKRRLLYVVGERQPLRFLNGRRSLKSVLSRNASAARSFQELYGRRFSTVGEYYATVRDLVKIVDLADIVPELRLPE